MAVLQSLISLWKRKGKKKKKKNSYCNTGYSYLVTHPSTNLTEQGLTLLNGLYMLLFLWYSDSTLNPMSDMFFSIPFHILEIFKKCVQRKSHYTTRTTTCIVRSTKLSPVRRGQYLGGLPNTNTPCCNNCFFFLFFPPSFSKAILRTAQLPSLCNVVVPHFVMAVFMCIYLHYRMYK